MGMHVSGSKFSSLESAESTCRIDTKPDKLSSFRPTNVSICRLLSSAGEPVMGSVEYVGNSLNCPGIISPAVEPALASRTSAKGSSACDEQDVEKDWVSGLC